MKHSTSTFATHVFVIASLVISQCEWRAFAQTAKGSADTALAENRHPAGGTDAVFLPPTESGGLFAVNTTHVTARTDAGPSMGSSLPDSGPGKLRAAVAVAAADASARPASFASDARAASTQGGSKGRTWMWILIAAGAGGAVAAAWMLKSPTPPSPTITVGVIEVGQ